MQKTVEFRSLQPDELMRQAAVPAEPNFDIGRVRFPECCSPAGQVGEAEAKTGLGRDTYVVSVEMTEDHCAFGFAWAGNPYMHAISSILGPARSIVADAAATIVNDVDCFGLRRPHDQRRNCRCNDAVSYRVISPHHFQACGVFFGASRPPIGGESPLAPQFLAAVTV